MSTEGLPRMIFVCGAPRSGVELVLDFLTVPRAAGWIPQKLGEHPDRLGHAHRVRRQSWFLLGDFFLERRSVWKSVPEPDPHGRFWEHYLPGFTPPDAEPVVPGPAHVTDEARERAREVARTLAAHERKSVLVCGYTGFPRIGLLRSVFPEAKFVQSIRDPRSVAYHMVRRIEGGNKPLWQHRDKWLALMPAELRRRAEELPDTPLVFCGLLTRWYHDLYKQELAALPEGDGLEVAYSDLLSRPEPTLKKVMHFAGFEMNKRFKYYLKFHDIQISNQRTNRNLNNREADQLARAVEAV